MDPQLRPLTTKEQQFLEAYCKTGDAKEAALRSGHGHDDKSARTQASQILKRPHIQAALTTITREQIATLEITGDRILREYAAIAFSDVGDFIQADTSGDERTFRIVDPLSLPTEKRAAIRKITEKATPSGLHSEVELHGKMQALGTLFKYLGLDRKGAAGVAEEVVGATTSNSDVPDSETARLYEAMKAGAK